MHSIAVFIGLTLPWINPFSVGPSPAVVPWLVTLACFACVLPWVRPVRLAEVAASAWLVAALLSSAIGLLQYFGATAAFEPWVDSAGVGEAFANLRQRNQFATLTNIGFSALLWCAARRHLPNWALLSAAALLAVGNAASASRTGMVQLALLVLLTLLWGDWHQPPARRVLFSAVLAYVVAALGLSWLAGFNPETTGILAHLQTGNPVCGNRLTLWRNVLYLIAQKPWLGWGWGGLEFAHFMTLYPGQRFCDILDNAHNLPLHLAVELGLPLSLLTCAAGLWLVWRAKPWRETDQTRQMAWSVMAVILLHSLLEYPLWYGPFQLAFGLALWMLWRRPSPSNETGAQAPVKSSLGVTLFAALLMAATGYVAWDYHRISQIYLSPEARSAAYRDNTLKKIGGSWLFRNSVRFAELTTTELTPANAAHVHELAAQLLHFSAEARVVEKLVDSAMLLGREDEARFYLLRYQAAFPESYAQWLSAHPEWRDNRSQAF